MRFKPLWMALAIAIMGSAAVAQDARRPSHCLAIAEATPGAA